MCDRTKNYVDEKSVLKIDFKIEIELLILNKALFCIPLRPGLIALGCMQLLATLVIAAFALSSRDINNAYPYQFIIFIISCVLEIFSCIFIIIGMDKKNADFVEFSYHYLKFKVSVTLILLIICMIVKLCGDYDRYWYFYNVDPWSFIIFFENQDLGFLVVVIQYYLFILVRSVLKNMDHQIDLDSLCQRICQQLSDLVLDDTEFSTLKDPTSLDSIKLLVDKEGYHKYCPCLYFQRFCTYLDNLVSNYVNCYQTTNKSLPKTLETATDSGQTLKIILSILIIISMTVIVMTMIIDHK